MSTAHRPSDAADDHGFTLIELMTVIVIIGILASIAVVVFISQKNKGYDAQAKSDVHQGALAEESYMADNGTFSTSIGAKPNNDIQLRQSPQVGPIKAWLTDTAGHRASGASGSTGFCLAAQSDSGSWFAYQSTLGGLQPVTYKSASKACPK